jgi:hypothetical protein
MLTASQLPFTKRAFFLTTSGLPLLGGPSSPVTANSPAVKTRSKLLADFIGNFPFLLKKFC